MIPYTDPDDIIAAGHRDLLLTDGTVTVSGTNYTVTGATVTIKNNIIENEAFELHQSLCSESQIRYGACEAASITFVIHENIPTLKGKTLKVYFALNPNDYVDSPIPVFDAGDKASYEDVPAMLKVRSDLSVRRAKELIAAAFAVDGIEKGEVQEHNHVRDISKDLKEKKK